MLDEERLSTSTRIKQLLQRDLKLGEDRPIADDMPLFGGDLDLDSLDALLLVRSIEAEFGVKIPNHAVGQQAFACIQTLADYVDQRMDADEIESIPEAPDWIDPGTLIGMLPHGEPFRLVDEIRSVRPGVGAEGIWRVRDDLPLLAGHFPEHPIVPGVLIVEALAQISGLVLVVQATVEPSKIDGRLAHMDVRFKRAVEPPCELVLRTRLDRSFGGLHSFQVEAAVDHGLVAEGTIELAVSASGPQG